VIIYNCNHERDGCEKQKREEVKKMALGDIVSMDLETKKLEIIFDTGIVGDKLILKRVYVPVNASTTIQEAYDMAYAFAEFSSYSLYGVEINSTQVLGPID
jgi:hypothetical protein